MLTECKAMNKPPVKLSIAPQSAPKFKLKFKLIDVGVIEIVIYIRNLDYQ